uniref:Uncharacterized protein n=1 Tax=Arundo donax TaxID=35708 RepID=A0A0A9BZ83_ARUDO
MEPTIISQLSLFPQITRNSTRFSFSFGNRTGWLIRLKILSSSEFAPFQNLLLNLS